MKRSLRLLCLLLCCTLLGGCGRSVEVPTFAPLPETAGLRVAVASDLHLNPDYTDTRVDPGAASYNLQLTEALLWDAREQGASLMLLTGDIVNGGKARRHEALIERLRRAEDAGLPVYVLPGNHDLSPVTQTEFARLYADFGYDEAFSRDAASLSYCVLREDLALLMLDTGGYPPSAIDLPDASARIDDGAFLSPSTLAWAEEMLREAEARGLPVLCAGHYNLLSAESRDPERSGYYLENGEKLAALLREHDVPLYLSGHLHIRSVLQEEGLTELVTEYLLAYPTGYSVLDLEAGQLRYTPRRVDVDAWAEATGQSSRVLRRYAAWQQEGLRDYSVENIRYMSQRNPLSHREARQAADFFYRVMDAFWRGTLFAEREELERLPGCEPFFRCAEGYAYGWWLRELQNNASPLLGGFTLEGHSVGDSGA